jgi:hypothetical protein
MYFSGQGVLQDYTKAQTWFRKAANQGDRDASYFLGVIYAGGLGVQQDPIQAAQWYQMAAEQGHAGAQTEIGLRYLTGNGVAGNDAIAARWMFRAAQQGIGVAELMLARMFASGRGVPKDMFATFAWAAVSEGRITDTRLKDQSLKLHQTAGNALTDEEITRAEKTISEWRPTVELPVQKSATTREQDGILASLKIQHGEALVSWRFIRPIMIPLSEITGTIDESPMGKPRLDPYPQAGATTSILFLLDVTDPQRKDQIEKAKLDLAEIIGRAKQYHQIAIAIFGERLQLLVTKTEDRAALIDKIKRAPPRNTPANLGRALRTALEIPPAHPAERNAVIVLTDGHSDDVVNSKDLIEIAQRTGKSVNFLLRSSARSTELPALEALASETGGAVVKEDQLADFVKAPFAILDSGATVYFPLNDTRGNYAGPNPEVKVLLQYGSNRLELKSTVVDDAWRERGTLEDIVRSCDGHCTNDFITKVQDRLNLLPEDERGGPRQSK